MKNWFYLLPVGAAIFVASCSKKNNETKQVNISEESYNQAKALFKSVSGRATSDENPLTPEKIELGKVLYYDTRLSKDGNISCNSCHNLATFGVDNKATSPGDDGTLGERNSPTVLNAAFHSTQFWDGRAKDVEEQAGMPILNPVEMAIPSEQFLVDRLSQIAEYKDLFVKAFPTDENPVSYNNIKKSIAAFERTLITPSPFDSFLNGNKSALTAQQISGLETFVKVGCTACHNGSLMGGNMFQKFGVYSDYRTLTNSKVNDEGRKKVTNQEADKDMFKVPSLRNIAKTAPYFHDGSVSNLNDAVKIMAKLNLNRDLTDQEIKDIVAFLESLTGDVPEKAKEIPAILSAKS
ncbi:MAG: cytochrome-c peroxidase [Flavobacteriales bacterium]|nr:cytochrome-c peroxidase [Flavobacteriales bacterium]